MCFVSMFAFRWLHYLLLRNFSNFNTVLAFITNVQPADTLTLDRPTHERTGRVHINLPGSALCVLMSSFLCVRNTNPATAHRTCVSYRLHRNIQRWISVYMCAWRERRPVLWEVKRHNFRSDAAGTTEGLCICMRVIKRMQKLRGWSLTISSRNDVSL